MKVLGMLFVILGTTGIGINRRKLLQERIDCIAQAIWLFRYMESEIGYQKSELAVVFERGAGRMEGIYPQILGNVAKRLQIRGGEDFVKIWTEEWDRSEARKILDKEELGMIRSFATSGYQDVHMQLIQIRMVREQLEKKKELLQTELLKKGKLYLSVGLLSGMVVSIILI